MLLCNSRIIFRSFTKFHDFFLFFFYKASTRNELSSREFFRGLIIVMEESRIATGQHLVSSAIPGRYFYTDRYRADIFTLINSYRSHTPGSPEKNRE